MHNSYYFNPGTFQVMVFVHARNETVRTATTLCEMAKNHGEISMFEPQQSPKYGLAEKQVKDLLYVKKCTLLLWNGMVKHHKYSVSS